jgi:hypothetical protein
MSLGEPINWNAPIQSPAAQPEAFRYQGESYVRMGNGQILQSDAYLAQQSALNNQAWRAAAANYDPDEPTRQAARAMESQPYRSPTTNQPVSREQFFNEHSQIHRQASNQYDAAMRQRIANAGTAWDTPLPSGVTIDMLPTNSGAFAPAPTAGAIVPARRGAPVGEAIRQPVNRGAAPRAAPIMARPGAGAGVGQGAIYGGVAAYGAVAGGGGFFEAAGVFAGGIVGGGIGGAAGGAVGGAVAGGVGTIALPVVGTVTGATAGAAVGGTIGATAGTGIGAAAGQGIGRIIDDLIPDFFDPPNATDPDVFDSGPVIVPGEPPPFTGGQSLGVLYDVRATGTGAGNDCSPISSPLELNGVPGPIGLQDVHDEAISAQTGGLCPGFSNNLQIVSTRNGAATFFGQGRGSKVTGFTVTRTDGQPDTGGDPPNARDPVRAPNPARPKPTGDPKPFPSPLPPPAPSDQPWPESPAQETPDTDPIPPPAPAPNFNPSFAPAPNDQPDADETPTSTDLDSPSPTPPDLDGKNSPPPAGDISKSIGGTSKGSPAKPSVLEVVIPIILLEGLRQKVNTPTGDLVDRTQPNPNVQITKVPPVQTATLPQPPTCIYERQRVMDIQNKATDVQEKASNPVSGFPGLYGIGIESRLKLGQTFTLMESVNQFMRKAWETTRIQKVLDLLTFIGVMHNVAMLSRNVGETFLEVVGQGLQAVGIRDEENNVIDVNEVVGDNVEGLLKNVLGVERYNGVSEAWNKANRIISTASAVIWSVRSIADAGQDLMEWTAENTGRIGNALKRWRVVGEDAYPDMSESAKAQHRMRNRFDKVTGALDNAEDRISVFGQATSGVIEIQEETNELAQNFGQFRESVINGVPDPWADNVPIKEANDEDKANSLAPNIEVSDSQKG